MSSDRVNRVRKEQAEAAFAKVSEGLLLAKEGVQEIIQLKAWEPLGYETFTAAWADRLSDVWPEATTVLATVLYQMIDEGSSDEQIVRAVKRVGVATVKLHRRARAEKMAPEDAHRAKSKVVDHSKPRFITVQVGHDRYVAWSEAAAARGHNLHDEVLEALTKWFGDA